MRVASLKLGRFSSGNRKVILDHALMRFTRRTVVLLSFVCCWWGGSWVSQLQADSIDCSQPPAGFEFRTLEDASGKHRYAVFTPQQYDPAKKWPVVLFLHGAGEKGTDGYAPLFGQLAVALEQWQSAPFIAVFPQCEDVNGRALTGWLADSPDGQRAMQILEAVEQDFSTDPKHRILVGWSMGGYGAWSLAANHAQEWSAVLILAGGALSNQLPLQNLAQAKTPVWAISSDGDPLIPFQRSKKLVEELDAAGGHGTFTLLKSNAHDICNLVFASKQTFQWLLDPKSINPQTIDLEHVKPLPARTAFYRDCQSETRVIPDALALRLGNTTFRKLAPDFPELLASTPIAGDLPDIQRTSGKGESQYQVRLSGVSYSCKLTKIWMHGIAGGRLGLEVDFEPLEMTIKQTTLDSAQNSARTGPIQIRIGIHEPAQLKLEVQPVMESGQLHLRLLRKNFDFDDGNWYIRPPDHVEAHSDRFTSDQLVTGIIGSLYDSKTDIVNQILGVVPDLVHRVEDELRMREAPGLAKMLSPLPVLVPELRVSPSHVSTDSRGVSVICNLNVSVRENTREVQPHHVLRIDQIPRGDKLAMEVALDAMTSLSQLNVDQNLAKVNVLDISEDKFAELADPEFMNQVLPDLHAEKDEQLTTVLRLLDPMVVSKSPQQTSSGTTELILKSSAAAIDVWKESSQSSSQPVGRIVFSLHQPISIVEPSNRNSPQAALQIRWAETCDVKFLRSEPLEGSTHPNVHAESFEKLFAAAWSSWGQENTSQQIPLEVRRFGGMELRLDALNVSDQELGLHFEAYPVPTDHSLDVSQSFETSQK